MHSEVSKREQKQDYLGTNLINIGEKKVSLVTFEMKENLWL